MVPGFTIDHSIDQVDLLKFFLQSFPFSNKTSEELQKLPNTSWLESQVQMLYLSVLSDYNDNHNHDNHDSHDVHGDHEDQLSMVTLVTMMT